MPGKKSNAHLILTQKCFYDENGKTIEPNTRAFTQWLHNNDSFRVVAGDDSYRARKEQYSQIYYWYGVKKVAGKLHKRFIGKPEDVTYERLSAVASNIRQPSAKSPPVENKQQNDSSHLTEEIASLKSQITSMQEHLAKLVEMQGKEIA